MTHAAEPIIHPPNMNYRMEQARGLVFTYVLEQIPIIYGPNAYPEFGPDDVAVVWFSKTLENWKALVITSLKDQMYYEVTYDAAKRQTYIDAYKKVDQQVVTDEGDPEMLNPFGDYMIHPRDMDNPGLSERDFHQKFDKAWNHDENEAGK